MRFHKLRIAWLVMCLPIGMLLPWVREFTYPKFEKLVLPSAGILIALSALTWLRFRFTLRTLLIGTTLIAVVPGLAIYSVVE
jgi:hypothetical protein